MRDLLAFDLGHVPGSVLALALLLPVLAAPLLGRGWRFAWGTRAAALVVAFGWLAVLDDRGSLPVQLPEPGIVLAPVAVGLAVAAGCVVASFELDVRGGSFGWRQPLAVLATSAILVGVLPGIAAVTSGRYETPRTTITDLIGFLPEHPGEGDYRVLWVGDARLLPAAGRPYRAGVGYALTDDRGLRVDQVWGTRPTSIDVDLVTALDAIADGSTARARAAARAVRGAVRHHPRHRRSRVDQRRHPAGAARVAGRAGRPAGPRPAERSAELHRVREPCVDPDAQHADGGRRRGEPRGGSGRDRSRRPVAARPGSWSVRTT